MIRMKVMIVYYSRTGNTRLVAEKIADGSRAEIEEIRDKENRGGVFGFLKSGHEAIFKKFVDIRPINKNPEEYDLVAIGSPVWAGGLSSPVRSYMALYGRKIKNVAFFVTYGVNKGKIFGHMEDLSNSPIATLEVKEKEVKSGEYTEKVEMFLQEVKTWFSRAVKEKKRKR